MELFDVIIVGSGPSAVSSLLSLKDKKVLILDVGVESSADTSHLNKSIAALKQEDSIKFSSVIGNNLESLNNINNDFLSPKVKAPLMRFVSESYERYNKFKTKNFFVLGSYAKGGLSNAWGGGSMRYTDDDLKSFPINYKNLKKYYDILTSQIGISGINDDLKDEFLVDEDLLPPPELNFLTKDLLKCYQEKNKYFHKNNFLIGFPRSAYITRKKGGREVYDYKGLEFFKPYMNSIYDSKFFLESLVKNNKNLTYMNKRLVISYKEQNGVVSVLRENTETQSNETFYSKKIILAAGCINTSKIVLKSSQNYTVKLPLLDSLVTYIPFINFKYIGRKEDLEFIPPQLLLIAKEKKKKYLCSMYKINATLCSDYLMDFPMSIKGAIAAVKYLVPSLLIMQVFYPDFKKKGNYLKLNEDNVIEIQYDEEEKRGLLEKKIITSFRKLGFYSLSLLIKKLTPGNSFHYSGTLPMKENPREFEVSADCKLHGSDGVFIVDGSVFCELPAKNNTFTIMANAMRVGDILAGQL